MEPTSMVSVDGNLYLAVQDLNRNGGASFNDAPSATIVKSANKGKLWTFDKKAYTFTFSDTWGDGIRVIGAPGERLSNTGH